MSEGIEEKQPMLDQREVSSLKGISPQEHMALAALATAVNTLESRIEQEPEIRNEEQAAFMFRLTRRLAKAAQNRGLVLLSKDEEDFPRFDTHDEH